MANKMNSTKVVTGVVRLSYANVWEPASINGSNPKYSVSLIIPKSDKQTLDAINAAVDAAIKEGVAKFGGKIPNKAALKLPLRDGDTERDDEAYKNSFFVNANSTTAARPRIAVSIYVMATDCFWLKPMSMSRWWTCPRSAFIGFCPLASRRIIAKQMSKIGTPKIRNGTANEMMA